MIKIFVNKGKGVRRDGGRDGWTKDPQRAARAAEGLGRRAAPGRGSGVRLRQTQQQPQPAGGKGDAAGQTDGHAAADGGEGVHMYSTGFPEILQRHYNPARGRIPVKRYGNSDTLVL